MKKVIILTIILFLAGCVPTEAPEPAITSYHECVAAGYPVEEFPYVKICTANGQNFTYQIEQPDIMPPGFDEPEPVDLGEILPSECYVENAKPVKASEGCLEHEDKIADVKGFKEPYVCCKERTDCRGKDYGCTTENIPCCRGLKSAPVTIESAGGCSVVTCGSICIECGDRRCEDNENWCNCPEDCPEIRTECTDADRQADVCITVYDPVCGYDSGRKHTYSNSCFACKDSLVNYWTEGEC
jgi:hypothetical protein